MLVPPCDAHTQRGFAALAGKSGSASASRLDPEGLARSGQGIQLAARAQRTDLLSGENSGAIDRKAKSPIRAALTRMLKSLTAHFSLVPIIPPRQREIGR